MFDALSAQSGERINASAADPEDKFSCPHCFFPVRLKSSRAGAFRPHFAHIDAGACKESIAPSEWFQSAFRLFQTRVGGEAVPRGGIFEWDALETDNAIYIFVPDFAKTRDMPQTLMEKRIVFVFETQVYGNEIELPKNMPGLIDGEVVAVCDGVNADVGQVKAIWAARIAVGMPHPLLGQAYVENAGKRHPHKMTFSRMEDVKLEAPPAETPVTYEYTGSEWD